MKLRSIQTVFSRDTHLFIMRKKVDKTIKEDQKVDKTIKADRGLLPGNPTVAQPRVAGSSRSNSSFPTPVYDDTVALSRVVASLRHPPAYDDTVAQSRARSVRSRIPPSPERPFKTHQFR